MRAAGLLFSTLRGPAIKLVAAALVAGGLGWVGTTQNAIGYGRATSTSEGFDISWPQCGKAYPGEHSVGVVGVTGGKPFTGNPCLRDEYRWALDQPQQRHRLSTPALYMNLAYGEQVSGPRLCEAWDLSCQAYNSGWAAAEHALAYARRAGAFSDVWWLDVETENRWSDRVDLNAHVVQGAIERLKKGGALVGIYSTSRMWRIITGDDYRPGLPNWVPGPNDLAEARAFCSADHSFGGGTVWLTQYPNGDFDGDYAC